MKGFRIILIFILILFQKSFLSAQESAEKNFRIGFAVGLGQYLQSDLKTLNNDVQNQLNFNARLIDNFPSNFDMLNNFPTRKMKTKVKINIHCGFIGVT